MTCGCSKEGTRIGLDPAQDCGCGCGGIKKSDAVKIKVSALSALIFYLIANPETFKLTRSVFGTWVAAEGGCPSAYGLFLHAFVFFVIVFGLMKLRV
jgi:hypothetical protein